MADNHIAQKYSLTIACESSVTTRIAGFKMRHKALREDHG